LLLLFSDLPKIWIAGGSVFFTCRTDEYVDTSTSGEAADIKGDVIDEFCIVSMTIGRLGKIETSTREGRVGRTGLSLIFKISEFLLTGELLGVV
jgi:hypothetical protein